MSDEYICSLTDVELLADLFSANRSLFISDSDDENLEICNRIYKIFEDENIIDTIKKVDNILKNSSRILSISSLILLLSVDSSKYITDYVVKLIIDYKRSYDFYKSDNVIIISIYDLFRFLFLLHSFNKPTFNFFVCNKITLYMYMWCLNREHNSSNHTTTKTYYKENYTYEWSSCEPTSPYKEYVDITNFWETDPKLFEKFAYVVGKCSKMYPFYYDDDMYITYYPRFKFKEIEKFICGVFIYFNKMNPDVSYRSRGAYNMIDYEPAKVNIDRTNEHYLDILEMWYKSEYVSVILRFRELGILEQIINVISSSDNPAILISYMDKFLSEISNIIIKYGIEKYRPNWWSLFDKPVAVGFNIFKNLIQSDHCKLNEENVLKLVYIIELFSLKKLEFNEQIYESLRDKSLGDIKEMIKSLDNII